MTFSKILMHSSAIVLLGAGMASADDMKTSANLDLDAKGSIEQLPKTGAVNLSGTVYAVEDKDTFILRDRTGATIDVHTASAFDVQKGARVSVSGQMGDEALGMGEEITSASVNVLSAATAKATTATKDMQAKADASAADADVKAKVGDNVLSVDADVKKTAKAGSAEGVASAERMKESVEANRNLPTNTNTAAYDVDVDVDSKEMASAADFEGETRIGNLPSQGRVVLTATVSEVNNNNKFTLRDNQGDTIDVNTSGKVNVSRGDTVKVTGDVKSELLGMGQEIQATDVTRINR